MPHHDNSSVFKASWSNNFLMSKYDSLLHKISTNPASNLVLTPPEQELLKEALITLQFLELIFKYV